MLLEAAKIDKKGMVITNKIMRWIGISQMEEPGVPMERVMCIIGHQDAKSYAKYCANNSKADDKVCKDLKCGTTTLAIWKIFNSRMCYYKGKRCVNFKRYI